MHFSGFLVRDFRWTQSMFYSHAGSGEVYAINRDGTTLDIFTGAIGLRTRFGNTASLDLECSLRGPVARCVVAEPDGSRQWSLEL
jgi:hypothetical protein